MRNILQIILLTCCYFGFSQTERLYYFIEKDSLLGVKNQNGKIIISPHLSEYASYCNGKEIKNMVFMVEFMKYYDRNGNFLFKPFPTGEGPDDFQEGFIRFYENEKVGLYSDRGEKIIPAKYDWLSPINFGFAKFCNGCYFDYSKDPEHAPLVGGIWGYVGKNGIEIQPTAKRNHPKDFETENRLFIPYQFEYNDKEKEILSFFEKRKAEIIEINGFECEDKIIHFEIIGKPTEFDPFYIIKTFEFCENYLIGYDNVDFKIFKVSRDGKQFYVTYTDFADHKTNSELIESKISIDKWIKQNHKKTKK